MATQHLKLVTQDKDLDVFALAAPPSQDSQFEQSTKHAVEERHCYGRQPPLCASSQVKPQIEFVHPSRQRQQRPSGSAGHEFACPAKPRVPLPKFESVDVKGRRADLATNRDRESARFSNGCGAGQSARAELYAKLVDRLEADTG